MTNVGERAMASACRMLGISYTEWQQNPDLRGPYTDARRIAISALDLMGLKRSSMAVMLKVSTVTCDLTLAKVRVDPYLSDMGVRCYEMMFLDKGVITTVERLEQNYAILLDKYDAIREMYQQTLAENRV